MALMVGQLLARIDADITGYEAKTKRVEQTHEQLIKKVAEPAKIDGDPKPFSQAADKVAQKSKDTSKQIDAAFGSTWKSVASDLQRIEQEAWDSGRGMDKAFTSALDDAKQSLQDLRSQAGKTGDGLNSELGAALRKLKGDVEELGEAGRKSGHELGQSLSEGLSEALGKVGGGGVGELVESFKGGKGAFMGAGLAVAGALVSGIQQRLAELKVGAMIAAQTGADASEIGRLGAMAGDLYASGFTDSLEEAGAAISSVVNVLIPADAADEAIGRIASKVSVLGQVMGEEFGQISRAARTMLYNGLAENAAGALDLIAEASNQGLNTAGDLLDTLDEYSGQFARLGLNGQEAMGLISQALQAGARDSDFAGDALKEFGIRAQDGSVATARGFKTIGLNAQEMGKMVAAGGASANSALRQTLNALQSMPEGIERNTAAVDLFGTKAEDLGDALYHMDLDNAADGFDHVAGSLEKMAQKLQEGLTGADKLDRGLAGMKSDIGDFLFDIGKFGESDELDKWQQKLNELAVAADQWMSTGDSSFLDELKQKYPDLSQMVDAFIEKNKGQVKAQNEAKGASDAATGSYEEQVRTLSDLVDMEQERAGGVVDLSEAQIGYQDSLAAANQALKENGAGLDVTTEAGRNNQGALNDLAKSTWDVIGAMEKQGATTKDVQKFVGDARTQYVQMATSMGLSAAQANALADKLGLIPGNYQATVEVLAAEHAANIVQNLLNKINALPAVKQVNLRVNMSGSGLGGHDLLGQASGGLVEYYADGGMRPMSGNAAGVVQSFSRTGVMRVIGDNPRFDEAFIPLNRASSRSQAILDEALRVMRPPTPQYTAGAGKAAGYAAADGMAAGTYVDHSDRSRSITVNAVQGVPTTQQLRDLQHEEEVLYGLP
jgi:phage-related minor tail protein